MDPYTPHGRPSSRKKNLTLSTKEYNKVTGTIASVRRTRQYLEEGLVEPANDALPPLRGSLVLDREPSFIAETSFGEGQLDGVPVEIQEALILEDLLFVLMVVPSLHALRVQSQVRATGNRGHPHSLPPDYSVETTTPAGRAIVVAPSLDASLRDLVERILPLATYYTAVTAFIEQRSLLDFGLVNHALCLASQLEHAFATSAQFTLQKLWFYVHPTLHTLSLLYLLITELATADDPSATLSDSESGGSSDAEEDARNEALGLGGANLKAVLSDINKGMDGGASGIPVKGGEVLAILHERMQNMSGDPAARALYGALMRAAGKPYVEMVQKWIRTGRLVDPYEELCIKESKFIDRGTLDVDYTDEYWERRYTLRDGTVPGGSSKRHQTGVPPPRSVGGHLPGGACVPPMLERWKSKMLLAGKYLNVIQECGIEIRRAAADGDDDDLSLQDDKFFKSIDDAYAHANKTLLELLLRDQQLIPRLRSLKRFFFLSQSSFLTHLLDLSHSELRKSAKSASLVKLQSLLDLALNTDTQGEDAMFREDLRVTMSNSGLYEWLLKVVSTRKEREKEKDDKKQILAIDALTLDYTVKFPLSLVISRKTILRYQLVFRFLLHLKHVEQSLSSMWIEHKTTPWRAPTHPPGAAAPSPADWQADFQNWRKRVFLLRARMLALCSNSCVATFEVLEPNGASLRQAGSRQGETVDQLLRDHVDFLDTCLKECMLTSSKLLKAYSKLIVTCSTFALYTSSFTKSASQLSSGRR
ncbi:gamma-tubulin complex component protein [Fomitopsis serialis]|uniref:gamma-tubulin complex component protein n=1 Tax=Fomitopsis serialis TaxID=139415 RepID=UPI002008D9DA|nr:gamma-tubulin complex component protein [Neoantrodia serialis]KAH9918094.1 gamma-tubulin complex component protein [Neoantrodia serialis]